MNLLKVYWDVEGDAVALRRADNNRMLHGVLKVSDIEARAGKVTGIVTLKVEVVARARPKRPRFAQRKWRL